MTLLTLLNLWPPFSPHVLPGKIVRLTRPDARPRHTVRAEPMPAKTSHARPTALVSHADGGG